MYALIETGGKQYKVSKDQVLDIEKLDSAAGDKVSINKVLMVCDGKNIKLGKPILENYNVVVEVVEQTRANKIIVFKKKRRKGYRRKHGHKQDLSTVKVLEIVEQKKQSVK